MPWECVGCANVFDVPTKPRICPECGSRQVICDEPDEARDAQRDKRFDALMGFVLGPRPDDDGDPVRVEDPADSDPPWAEGRSDNN